MSKNKQQLWLFSILLIYIAIAVAGFTIAYVIKNDFLPKTSSIPIPTQPTTKTPTISVPTGWSTYTNTDYKLQFAYPSTDTIKAKSYGFGVTSLALTNKNGNVDFQILFLPKSLAQAVGQDFDSYYSMSDNTTKTVKSPLSQDNTTEKFTKINNTTVDANRAINYKSIASNAKPDTQPEIGTFIETGNNLVLFSTVPNNKNKLEEMLKLFHYPI
jgi:hypothetical protein